MGDVKPELHDLQQLLQLELGKISEQLSQDLRRDLSSFLSTWSSRLSERTQDLEKSPTWRSEVVENPKVTASPPTPIIPPLATPLSLFSKLQDHGETEKDFARMRMKARTYTGTEGIGGPMPEGTTLFGTPKNSSKLVPKQGAGKDRRPSITVPDDGKQPIPGSPKAIVPQNAPSGGEKRRSSDRASKMREPRSIFLYHLPTKEDEGLEEADEEEVEDVETASCRRETFCSCIQRLCLQLVCLEYFDYVMGLAILANAVLMGVQADLAVQNARTGELEPPIIRVLAVALGGIFTFELVVRILAYRMDFFTKPGWRWNMFDFMLVFLQLSEEIVTALVYNSGDDAVSVNLSFMRILRVLRLVRIVRLVRVLRLIRELRTLVQSIASTMTSLLWTVALLLLLIFVVGICFTQVVADVGLEQPDTVQEGTDTYEFYGSLLRSVMSLYQSITSGVSWRDASQPLERHQPVMGLVFAVYIAFAALAMLNVITGVFVESAMASAREENTVTVVSRMREIVAKMNIGESGRMTWGQFQGQLNNPIMEAYFKSLDLSVTEAESLFRLLDIDNEGSIDVEEFIAGCCRIHGPAKAIDLTTLMCQVMLLHRQWRQHANLVEEYLHCVGFTVGGDTPATHHSLSPHGKGTPRRKFSFCITPDLEEKALEPGAVELHDLGEPKALPERFDAGASPLVTPPNLRSVHSEKQQRNALPSSGPLSL
mmetsp:Transcript_55895/g.130584  ORF Transcript_55895/g.130584 Transcript_55895/m.130584 type:complete len:711 (-) Transcript_55895:53-2185(-)